MLQSARTASTRISRTDGIASLKARSAQAAFRTAGPSRSYALASSAGLRSGLSTRKEVFAAAQLNLSYGAQRSFSWTPWRKPEAAVDQAAAVPTSPAVTAEASSSGSVASTANAAVSPVSSSSSGAPSAPAPSAASSAPAEAAATSVSTPSSPISIEAADTAAQTIHYPQPPAEVGNLSIEQLIAQNPGNLAEVLNSPEAVHAAMRVGDLKLMGLDHSIINPAGWLRDAMEIIHVGIGLPWWATILVVTFCLRSALFPFVARMQGNNARLQAIKPQQEALMSKMSEAKKAGDQMAMSVYMRQLQQLFKDHDCHPLKTLVLPLTQIPLVMTVFFALRKMITLPVPQLKEGGLWWFTDLTLPDPYYILPITSLIFQLAVLELGADGTAGVANRDKNGQHLRNVFRVVSAIAVPFVGQMASAFTFYWSLSAALTLLQSSLLRTSAIRRIMRLPPLPAPAPPPPGTSAASLKPPTLRDTFRTGMDAVKNHFKSAREEAERRAHMEALSRSGRSIAQRVDNPSAMPASLQAQEVIREHQPTATAAAAAATTVASSTSSSAGPEATQAQPEANGVEGPSSTSTSTSKKVNIPKNSKVLNAVADAKRARIEAARARREGRK